MLTTIVVVAGFLILLAFALGHIRLVHDRATGRWRLWIFAGGRRK